MELLRKWRKAILPCAAPLLCILGLAGCSRDAPERIRSQLSRLLEPAVQDGMPSSAACRAGMLSCS